MLMIRQLFHKNEFYGYNHKYKSNKSNQDPNTTLIIFSMKFQVFSIGVNQSTDKSNYK